MGPASSEDQLAARVRELEDQLQEARAALDAIHAGKADAAVGDSRRGDGVVASQYGDSAYRVFVENMREGAVTLAPDGLILSSNRQFAAMVRAPLEHVIASRIQNYIESPGQLTLDAILDVPPGGRKLEAFIRCPDEARLPAHLSLNTLTLDGAPIICLVVSDLSDRKRSEEIVAAERLARSILDQAAEAIAVVDPAGMIVRASQAAARLAGEDVLCRNFHEVFPLLPARDPGNPGEGGGCGGSAGRLDLPGGGPLEKSVASLEACFMRADGKARQVIVSANPLRSESGTYLGFVVTLTDITGRKELERKLQEQTRILARSNEDLQQFAYIISHDLQEPLRSASGFAKLISQRYSEALEPAGLELLKYLTDSVDRMRVMITDLLSYSRIVHEEKQGFATVDMNTVLGWALSNLRGAIRESDVSITHDSLPAVPGDHTRLAQLLQNLIANAIKYRSEQPPRIHIGSARRDKDCIIWVEDNGLGIDPKHADVIFRVFKRLHGREYPGTGIGLAICRKIVERHGGRLWVESEPGKGSKFLFTIPAE